MGLAFAGSLETKLKTDCFVWFYAVLVRECFTLCVRVSLIPEGRRWSLVKEDGVGFSWIWSSFVDKAEPWEVVYAVKPRSYLVGTLDDSLGVDAHAAPLTEKSVRVLELSLDKVERVPHGKI